ncbi:solute carrier family 35 member D3 [Hemitrygon akajei]|uniref:solute carrier family 35 member D3 n=1 Tax=Hemitrygon akajei TaxID=2704970 RepID=UPI003BFA2C46
MEDLHCCPKRQWRNSQLDFPPQLPFIGMAVPGSAGSRKWLQCCCWLSACVVYTACSALFEFFSRIFISQYRFTFPAFIVLCQALLTIVILQLLKRARLLKIEPYLLKRGEIFLLPSICFSFHSILIMWAVTASYSTVFMFIRQFTPMASLALMQTFNLKKRASSSIGHLVLMVTLCSVLAGARRFNDEAIVYIYGLLNLMLESMYLILLQKICEDQNTSVMDVHYTCTINSCPLLFVYCLLHPGTQQIYMSGSWTSLIFLGFFSLVLILGCLLKLLICLCTLLSSALMVSMMEVGKTDALTLRSIIANKWTFSSPQLTSLLISASGIGIFLYKVSRETNISTRKEALGIQR